ncbi:MAG: O-methyltransferase [Bacteroidales bacterium]|nr:O-methyltransferase [Bacteroidales bacterium]
MESPEDRYIRLHSTAADEALFWVERQTNIRSHYPQMLTGPVQGRLLTMLVEMTGAKRILEIGTFTGYSTICLARGLNGNGHVDTLEINDELEGLIREGWERAGVSDCITLHITDARKFLASATEQYDFVYIDANKREYCDYYEGVLPLLSQGGIILADDVLMGGKVYDDPPSGDRQTSGLVEFNERVSRDERVETVILPIRDGLSIIRKKL